MVRIVEVSGKEAKEHDAKCGLLVLPVIVLSRALRYFEYIGTKRLTKHPQPLSTRFRVLGLGFKVLCLEDGFKD